MGNFPRLAFEKIIEFSKIYKKIIAILIFFITLVSPYLLNMLSEDKLLDITCDTIGIFCPKEIHINPPSLDNVLWVAYSPTNFNPNINKQPSEEDIKQDLKKLYNANFRGLVTYSSKGILGSKLPDIANDIGFTHMFMGIYNIKGGDEIPNAINSSRNKIIKGYVIGNEGLYPKDKTQPNPLYSINELRHVMYKIRNKTGKPVTTSEGSENYLNDNGRELLEIGDWVFPNAHPYYAGVADPEQAVAWIEKLINKIERATDKPIFLKEVGLPTVGGQYGPASQDDQEFFYRILYLSNLKNKFIYFEAFDQPWKDSNTEKSWGLFSANRAPKKVVPYIGCPNNNCPIVDSNEQEIHAIHPHDNVYVYKDFNDPKNMFNPEMYMGDIGDLKLNESYHDRNTGAKNIRLIYTPTGRAPSVCTYLPPCRWAGIKWVYPPSNLGQSAQGIDLTGYRRLIFSARGTERAKVKFLVGGLSGRYPDTITNPVSNIVTLNTNWTRYYINLNGHNLSHIIAGFGVVLNWDNNNITYPNNTPIIVDIDDIYFER